MPRVNRNAHSRFPVVIFEEVFITDISVSKVDENNPEPARFYVGGLINGEESQITVTGLNAVEFEKWINLPPVPVRIQTELHFGQFTREGQTAVSVRWHVPQILGMAESIAHMLTANGKKQAQS